MVVCRTVRYGKVHLHRKKKIVQTKSQKINLIAPSSPKEINSPTKKVKDRLIVCSHPIEGGLESNGMEELVEAMPLVPRMQAGSGRACESKEGSPSAEISFLSGGLPERGTCTIATKIGGKRVLWVNEI